MLFPKLRPECRCGRATARTLLTGTAGLAMMCKHSPSADRRENRKGIPALPFCHLRLSTQKPKSSVYPKELKTLGDHIRRRRLDLGLLQRQVAQLISVDVM